VLDDFEGYALAFAVRFLSHAARYAGSILTICSAYKSVNTDPSMTPGREGTGTTWKSVGSGVSINVPVCCEPSSNVTVTRFSIQGAISSIVMPRL
jgi:hypothetical protein